MSRAGARRIAGLRGAYRTAALDRCVRHATSKAPSVMIKTVATVAVCVLGAAGCAASSETSTTDGIMRTARSTNELEEGVLGGPCYPLLAEKGGIGGDPPSDLEEVNQACAARTHPQAMEAQGQSLEPIGEATEDLTKWQQRCTLGCATLAAAGCASVSASCTAGAVWSFGGILIPCAYAVVAACAGSASITTVCAIKCAGG